MKLRYVEDLSGNQLLEDEDGIHQVMMEWEKPYMEKCIDLLDPSGRALEIGFGMGYSANKICSNNNVISYTIVECSPVVWKKVEEFKSKYFKLRPELEIILIKGRWQDMLDTLDIYDSIYFDDYASENFEENYNRFNKFLYEILKNHSIIGTKIGLYSTTNIVKDLDCVNNTITDYKIDIPKNCKYAAGDRMYIPIIEKIAECEENLKQKIFKRDNIKYLIPSISTSIIVIDNFLVNPVETYNYAKKQNFKASVLYPGKRSQSFVNDSIKLCIEKYIMSNAGKIIDFDMKQNDINFNGCYEYTNSYDKSYIRTDTDNKPNNWCGILYLSPSYEYTSGISLYTSKIVSINNLSKKDILDNYSHDMTKWSKQDYISNKYNRLVLFRANQYYMCNNYFGNNEHDGRLVQLFFFTTEN